MSVNDASGAVLVQLRQWVESSKHQPHPPVPESSEMDQLGSKKNTLLVNTTLAYCLTNVLHHVLQNHLVSGADELKNLCSIDNFIIQFSSESPSPQTNPKWKDITGLVMISPYLQLQIVEHLHSNNSHFGENNSAFSGRYLEVKINNIIRSANPINQQDEQNCCHFLGVLLYELFSGGQPFPPNILHRMKRSRNSDEPPRKKIAVQSTRKQNAENPGTVEPLTHPDAITNNSDNSRMLGGKSLYMTLLELGFPSSVSSVVGDLLDCCWKDGLPNNSYLQMEAASKDLHLLICDPERFLFEQDCGNSQPSMENGGVSLQFRNDKLYGREREYKLLSDAFERVSSGPNEALFISGASGSGKTSIAENLAKHVEAVGGFVVKEKIDLFEQEAYSLVLAAFNTLCCMIRDRASSEELQRIIDMLMNEFYSDLSLLGHLMPDFYTLCPQLKPVNMAKAHGFKINLDGTAYVLKLFMKVVSSATHPVMLFLDDLQWADAMALNLVRKILSGAGGSSFFFVGSFREKEVDPDHPIFEMVNKLEIDGVPHSTLHLDELNSEQVNHMVSDALCMLPRLCQPLSDFVSQNTKGNPLFIQQVLRSLINDGLLKYSIEGKRWVWDIGKIISTNLTDDVLCLLTSNLNRLEEGFRTSLSVVACFGIKISETIAQLLSSTAQFSNLPYFLGQAVANGYMLKENGHFRFVHDKIREAAYNIIPEKNSFHFEIAFLLNSVCEREQLDNLIYVICDQFKRSKDYMHKKHSTPIDLLGLFMKAGSKALATSDFPRARSYSVVAESLLPINHWESCYGLCINIFFLRAKSEYSCGFVEEAKNAIKQILDNGHCLDDKLDAYYLLASIHFHQFEGEKSYSICRDVVSELHEPVPQLVDPTVVAITVKKMSARLTGMSESDLLGLKDADEKLQWTHRFYSLLSIVSFVFKPKLLPLSICKMIDLCLSEGVSKHTAVSFVCFASMLCTNSPLVDISSAKTVGKLAMAFGNRFDLTRQRLILTLCYTGFVGYYVEPFLESMGKHVASFNVGMSMGETTFALMHPYHVLRSGFFAGENLFELLKKTDHYMEIAKEHNSLHAITSMQEYRKLILSLIGKTVPYDKTFAEKYEGHLKHLNFVASTQSFWLRCHERCEYLCLKVIDIKEGYWLNIICANMAFFFRGLNVLHLRRGKSSSQKISLVTHSIEELKRLATYCEANFQNKVFLLEAELFSSKKENNEASESYAASIEAAHKSKFVHEEGLACELAGFHFLGIGESAKALDHFNRAKKCYTAWGSQVKVNSIQHQIDAISKKCS